MVQKLARCGAFGGIILSMGLIGCGGEEVLPEVLPQPTFTPDEGRDATDERLGQLSVALMRYVSRHNRQLPDTSSIESLQRDLKGYLNERPVGGEEIFQAAETGDKFATNPAVSRKNIYLGGDGSGIVLIYQAKPSVNDTRPIVFGDGSYRRIGENEWPKIEQRSTNILARLMKIAGEKASVTGPSAVSNAVSSAAPSGTAVETPTETPTETPVGATQG